jgi:1-aminocyclopropane-1-carboxylate deaminase
MFNFNNIASINQEISLPILNKYNKKIYFKREDLIHPIISGNKFRKLKYNIKEALKINKTHLISFGGAYSNHLLALSYIGKLYGLSTLGIIRGEELLKKKLNSTLQKCNDFGMKFVYVSREEYRKRNHIKYIDSLQKLYKDSFIIPEGGTNHLGVKGCEEILTKKDEDFDVICCPVGSGGTISGLINSKNKNQKVLGFSALKASGINNVISNFVNNNNWELYDDVFFGGYSQVDNRLVSFINETYSSTGVLLDPIYNSKMLFRIINLILIDKWIYGDKILIINTGGLQSVYEMNLKLKKKGCITINH